MNGIHTDAISIIKKWFEKAEDWQKDLFCQIWQGNEDVEKLTVRAFALAKVEYLGENSKFAPSTTFPSAVEFSNTSNCPVILKSISEVQGVGALSPTRPLEFGDNLTIVYGENGCGKSSYVRILKSAVSPKNSNAIIGDIYKTDCPSPQALLTYSDDGNEQQIHWKPSMKSTCPLNIYDSSIAKRFAEEKNEVIYEPHILSILSIMTTVYEGVKAKFDEISSENLAQQTALGKDVNSHKSITDFLALKTIKAYDKFISDNIWDENQQKQLSSLQEGLQDQDPSKQLKALQAQKGVVDKQYQILIDLITKTGNSFSEEYLLQRKAQIETKREADNLIEGLNKVSVLNKTGSDKWKKMWDAAVKFSKESTSDVSNTIIAGGKCILCQQDISDEANKRIAEFYKYMTSAAIKESEKAHSTFETTVEQLKNIYSSINIEQVESLLRSSSIEDDAIQYIIEQYKNIKARCKWLLEYTDDIETTIPVSSEIKVLQDAKEKLLNDYATRIKSLQDNMKDHANDGITENLQWIITGACSQVNKQKEGDPIVGTSERKALSASSTDRWVDVLVNNKNLKGVLGYHGQAPSADAAKPDYQVIDDFLNYCSPEHSDYERSTIHDAWIKANAFYSKILPDTLPCGLIVKEHYDEDFLYDSLISTDEVSCDYIYRYTARYVVVASISDKDIGYVSYDDEMIIPNAVNAIRRYYGSAIDDNSISDEIMAIDRECFSNTGEFIASNIDEYIFNVSVDNNSTSKKMVKKSNTSISKLVRYCPETDTVEELI